MKLSLLLLGCVSLLTGLPAATPDVPVPASRWLKEQWTAHWITHPDAPKNEYGVYLFRKEFVLAAAPTRFVIHVSADARYRLWVNGRSVSFGPQRSDQWVCHYDTIDLTPWLQVGKNVLAAQVWSYGQWAPYATTSVQTGLLVQGDSDVEAAVNSSESWTVQRDASISPLPIKLPTYIVIGAGVRVDGAQHPWDWQSPGFADAGWRHARVLGFGNPYGRGTDMDHWLQPRTIPPMEESLVRFSGIRRTSGVEPSAKFVTGEDAFTVPAHTKASVLFDQGTETNAFTKLVVSGGRASQMKLTYAEALIDEAGKKGNRDEIERRRISGVIDEFITDGGDKREFGPLDFRTYRYVQLDIETADEPLRVEDLRGQYTAYPFAENAAFTSDDPQLARIWTVGWRTARLCAFETYMDCPYYEQLQYVGDTRIQSLISLFVSGDDRLMRNAIELFDRSRIAEGLTQSRFPSVTPQVINTFSLFWIDMVHDYWMHRTDAAFVRARLPGIESVLGWFERKIDSSTGILGPMSYWTFVDWTKEWAWDNALGVGGEPEGARAGGSSIVTLQLVGTLRRAAELCGAMGRADLAQRYLGLATRLGAATRKLCWDEQRQMFADSPAKKDYSQHANTMAVLSGVIEGSAATRLMRKVANDRSLIQSSTYFRFYLLRAMKKAGLGDEYLAQLGPWQDMLAIGLTTFAEQPDPTRSDCHAWSASPIYEFLATVCGVEPGAPGFGTVRIEPHLGALKTAQARIPHPAGDIAVNYRKSERGLSATISLPAGVRGTFIWRGNSHPLKSGEQTLQFP
ncbi:MAG: family 78 glycoside hydrolase catalytic domain [Opitutus sp.]